MHIKTCLTEKIDKQNNFRNLSQKCFKKYKQTPLFRSKLILDAEIQTFSNGSKNIVIYKLY